ncbi:MAG: glycoside hydrolase family 25 protein [Actinobacteria bacterium]|nr:glycoside hydrolase family 25 protein [Actinomycetota bacterium]
MSRRYVAIILGVILIAFGLNSSSADAGSYSLSLALKQTPSVGEPLVTLYGQITPRRSALKVEINVQIAGKWQETSLSTRTNLAGTWKIETVATALNATATYRATTVAGGTRLYSPFRTISIKQGPQMSEYDPTSLIEETGPGGRIHGADISRWQHPGDAPIDFDKMYAAGVRFVMIKASDTRDTSDAITLKYVAMDHDAAQAAGIYTGFYHYATLPDSTDPNVIETDARAQAQKAVWRLASLGGYTSRDLSYALDLENNCVRFSNGACTKYTSKALVTLWAETWLADVAAKTGRTPILYSYSQFLENAMMRSPALNQYPLWIAHYSLNPADPLAQPGQKNSGCYVHSWTTANCSSLWMMWQYTSCGIAKKYGVPGGRLDLNVFRGTPNAFLELMQGTWEPEVADLMPIKEPSQTQIVNVKASTTDKPVVISIQVTRPTGEPVVTGTVKFVPDKSNPVYLPIIQSVTRSSSGRYSLIVKGMPVGTWLGRVSFTDGTGTHAKSIAPLTLTIAQGPFPTPTPTTTSVPSPKPSSTGTTDPCKNQIRN